MWQRLGRVKFTKEALYLVLGTAGFINEFFIRHGTERPYILSACALLVGLPVTLGADKQKKKRRQGGDDDT